MALSLTEAEATAKMNQVDDAMNTARTMGNRILDTTQTMTSGSWLGGKAATFNAIMTQHRDDFEIVINRLQQVANTGKEHIRAITAHENS